MVDKSSFSPEEWARIRDSVMMAGLAVSLAEPSGLIGMLQEGAASARALKEIKADDRASDLFRAIAAEFDTAEGRAGLRADMSAMLKGKSPTEARRAAIDVLSQAVTILESRAPFEAAGFKRWLHDVAVHVAEAAKEGGFLGFGGTPVSDAEKATIADIDRAIRLEA